MDDRSTSTAGHDIANKGDRGGRVSSPAAAAATPTASVMESEVSDDINGHGSHGTIESSLTPAATVTVRIELGR